MKQLILEYIKLTNLDYQPVAKIFGTNVRELINILDMEILSESKNHAMVINETETKCLHFNKVGKKWHCVTENIVDKDNDIIFTESEA